MTSRLPIPPAHLHVIYEKLCRCNAVAKGSNTDASRQEFVDLLNETLPRTLEEANTRELYRVILGFSGKQLPKFLHQHRLNCLILLLNGEAIHKHFDLTFYPSFVNGRYEATDYIPNKDDRIQLKKKDSGEPNVLKKTSGERRGRVVTRQSGETIFQLNLGGGDIPQHDIDNSTDTSSDDNH